jgi:lipopolysaccharide export system permease protein
MSIGYLNIAEKYMKDIIIDEYDDKYYLTKNIVVGEGQYTNGGWLLKHGVIRTFDDKNNWNEQYFDSKVFGFTVKPRDLIVKDTRYEQMNLKTFKEYIRKKQMLGENTLKEQIKYHSRFANVFAHIIVMMIGIPFALGLGNKFGKIISFTFALIFSFIYWCVQAVCMSLGENQIVAVWLAAWLPNIIFGVVGIYLMSKIKK